MLQPKQTKYTERIRTLSFWININIDKHAQQKQSHNHKASMRIGSGGGCFECKETFRPELLICQKQYDAYQITKEYFYKCHLMKSLSLTFIRTHRTQFN